jgi:hypothetical protein
VLDGHKDILPVCIKAGALAGNVPRRDLWISPHHAMYFDNTYFKAALGDAPVESLLIEAKDLVNGSSIIQAERVDKVEYFHVELDTHDVIVAEGAWSETFLDDNGRAMFHNAHEFRALYPDTDIAAQYCAPRLEDGYEVAAVRRRIALRAGLLPSADPHRASVLRGYVDDGQLLGQTLANRFRKDLAVAGLGSGRHAFKFELPVGLTIGAYAIEVRRSLDGRRLPGISRTRSAA